MTVEEKAKAYDEALKKVQPLYEQAKKDGNPIWSTYEHLFPQLRESKDERIRHALIEFLREAYSRGNAPEECAKWIVWLDQPKEQKPYGQRDECNDCQANYAGSCKGTCEMKRKESLRDFIDDFPYTDVQKEQKPAEWSEDWREEDIQTRFAFYTYKDDPSVLYLSNVFVEEASRNHGFGTRILKAAEKVAEAIGATTICLKVKQDSPANAWYRKNGYSYAAFDDDYDWLQKNLEYLNPAKQEWSEEDEEALREVKLNFELNHDNMTPKLVGFYERFFNKLKSLRTQPHYKLSKEQESVAERFARIVRGNLSGIDEKVQQEFEHLYFEITGNKMYGGYND